MTTNTIPPEINQLPLFSMDASFSQVSITKHKKKVEETFAKIRALHDELNTQLYRNPTERPLINSPADAARILNYFIGDLDHEELWVINLDTRNKVMSLVKLYVGSVNSSQVRVSEVFRQAIVENAPGILLAHNHPSGDNSPSSEDIALTRAIYSAGKMLDIDCLDHIVVSKGKFVSLKERGFGFS